MFHFLVCGLHPACFVWMDVMHLPHNSCQRIKQMECSTSLVEARTREKEEANNSFVWFSGHKLRPVLPWLCCLEESTCCLKSVAASHIVRLNWDMFLAQQQSKHEKVRYQITSKSKKKCALNRYFYLLIFLNKSLWVNNQNKNKRGFGPSAQCSIINNNNNNNDINWILWNHSMETSCTGPSWFWMVFWQCKNLQI